MDDRRPAIVGVIITFLVLSWISIGVRIYVRRSMIGQLGWDDKLILAAMIPVLAQVTFQLLTTKHGLGLHISDIDLSSLPTIFYLVWWSGISFNLSHLFIKLSYLAFYLRLIPHGNTRMVVYAGIGFVMSVGITFTVLSIFMCTPIERGWDKTVPGTCINDSAFLFSNTAFNMAADVIVFALPVPTLWRLQLPMRQKFILMCIFASGSIVLVASAVRLSTMFKLVLPPTRDPTWELAPLILWSEVEVNMAVILSCTASFKTLLQTIFPNFMQSFISGSATKKSGAGRNTNGYALRDLNVEGLGTCHTVIKASCAQDAGSLDSREHIVGIKTTISVHSSKKESVDGDFEILPAGEAGGSRSC